jgi:hypothetical protein
MAAAARPGSGSPSGEARDARVPCPLCGGLIHPIAGRCKHCKADLGTYRAARPAASAPLPALHPTATAGNGASGPVAHAVAMPAAAQGARSPQPGRAATGQPAGSAWRSWPVVVIVVAMMAIVAAVVLMVWPVTHGEAGRSLPPPPAPEHMDTQTPPVMPKIDTRPAPGHAPADPSGGPHASGPRAPAAPDPFASPHARPPAAPDPFASPHANAPADPDSSDDQAQADPVTSDDDPAADDPFSSPHATPPTRGRPSMRTNPSGMLQITMAARLCRKLARCGTTDSTMKNMCEQIAIMGVPADPPAGCPAAERCLRHIDAMGCSSQPDALQLGLLMMQFSDCVAAMHC